MKTLICPLFKLGMPMHEPARKTAPPKYRQQMQEWCLATALARAEMHGRGEVWWPWAAWDDGYCAWLTNHQAGTYVRGDDWRELKDAARNRNAAYWARQ